jgi:hypothetical protein
MAYRSGKCRIEIGLSIVEFKPGLTECDYRRIAGTSELGKWRHLTFVNTPQGFLQHLAF